MIFIEKVLFFNIPDPDYEYVGCFNADLKVITVHILAVTAYNGTTCMTACFAAGWRYAGNLAHFFVLFPRAFQKSNFFWIKMINWPTALLCPSNIHPKFGSYLAWFLSGVWRAVGQFNALIFQKVAFLECPIMLWAECQKMVECHLSHHSQNTKTGLPQCPTSDRPTSLQYNDHNNIQVLTMPTW